MTAKSPTARRHTVKYPRVVAPSPPHVVAPKVADPSGPLIDSPLSNSPPTAPSLETEHLYEYVKWVLDIRGGHFLDAILEVMQGMFALSFGMVFCVILYNPDGPADAPTWTAKWFEGGYVYLSATVLFLVKWVATICILWPTNVVVCALGAFYFVVAHGLLLGPISLVVALLYSTYSTRTLPVSSLFTISFPKPMADFIDFFTPVGVLHYLIRSLGPANFPFFFPILIVSYANALLLVFGTSFPHLVSRFYVAIDFSGWRQGGSSCGAEEIEEMKKEIEKLKGMLLGAN